MIIVYECDTCSRQVELEENQKGLTTVGNCVITENCSGKLFRVKRKNTSIPIEPLPVLGLTNWTRQGILYNHTQHIRSSTWEINHNLNSDPSFSVFVSPSSSADPTIDLEEVVPKEILFINGNTTQIRLPDEIGPRIGICQAVARTSATVEDATTPSAEPSLYTPFTLVNNITIAWKIPSFQQSAPPALELTLEFINIESGEVHAVENLEAVQTNPTVAAWDSHNRIDFTVASDGFYQLYRFDVPISYQSSLFSFKINSINGLSLDQHQAILLLSSEPYELGDEIVDQIIDMSNITENNKKAAFQLSTSIVSVRTSLIESVFPPIRKI